MPFLFVLKITLVPCCIGAVSLAGRRWGPAVAGSLAGMPLVLGPILFLLWLENGVDFGRSATMYSLAAVFPIGVFLTTYAMISRRFGWSAAIAWTYLAWLASALSLLVIPFNFFVAATLAITSVFVTRQLLPHPKLTPLPIKLPRIELLIRMFAGAALTLLVTSIASVAGTRISGVLAIFPILTTVLTVFTHRSGGREAVIATFRGMVRGLCSLVTFCLTLILLPTDSVALAFAVAIGASLVTQAFLDLLKRAPRFVD